MKYYAMRWSIKNGTVTPNNRTGEKADMERQFHLYCASAASNADANEFDAVEFGTLEGGALDRKVWEHQAI